ncbi:MAG: hypothetical protein LBW77_05365 [Verrucomicrobiota bacterium]|jgi:hypothetical protein|nr:hypothetical protein [Verrucomicrobiota bacterium]
MSNLIENAKRTVIQAMAFRFPKYPVRFECVEGDAMVLGVGVFGVPVADFVAVQDYVFDLEASVALPDGWELLPLVRDPVVTQTHYPEINRGWPTTICFDAQSCASVELGPSLPTEPRRWSLESVLSNANVREGGWTNERQTGCAASRLTSSAGIGSAA